MLQHAAQLAGLTDPPPPAPITVSVLADASSRACTPERLRTILTWALTTVAEHPGSSIRLFGLGHDLTSTTLLGEQTSTPSPSPAVAAINAHRERFRTTALEALTTAARPLWTERNQASPIAEGLAAIAQFPTAHQHVMLVLSDLRQESGLGHFECGPFPSPAAWTQRTKSLFAHLRGATVIVAFASPLEPVTGQRCSSTNERYDQLITLWTAAITNSGARFSVFPDAPQGSLDQLLGGQQ